MISEGKLENPLVSVLITVFNRETYLATAIESVLAQTLRDIEIIVLDDCSTDASWQIAQRYADDPRVRLYRNEENLKQFPTRNKIATLARGKYLKYLDSDDALLPHCLEMMAHMMECHPEAGMLLWSSEGESSYPFLLSPHDAYLRGFTLGRRFDRAPLSTLLRKECFESVHGFDTKWPLCADSEIIYRLARYHPVLYGPHGLVFYRVHAGQVFSSEQDGHNRRIVEELSIVISALRHPDCPLPEEERSWQLARMIYGAGRKTLDLAFKQRRWKAALDFWRMLDISLAEMLPALRRRPTPPTLNQPAAPDWDDFPITALPASTSSPLVTVIVAPGENSDQIRLCLDSLRHQRLANIEVLVADSGEWPDVPAIVHSLGDERFRCVPVSAGTGALASFNQAAAQARGEYCKFIGPGCPLLYPYALEIETAILEKRPGYSFVSAGFAAFTLGGLALSPRETLALDIGSGGGCLRVDPSCVLLRRSALPAELFDTTLGDWAMPTLLYRLATLSGAILGPYGLSTAWQRGAALPAGDLPDQLKHLTIEICGADQPEAGQVNWADLVSEGKRLLGSIEEKCQWHDPAWVVPDTAPVHLQAGRKREECQCRS